MSKIVALSKEAYDTLLRRKKGNESFSDVVIRDLGKKTKPDIMQFAGILKDSKAEWKEVERQLAKERHSAKLRE